MTYAIVAAQGLIALTCFLVPGWAVLARLASGREKDWPLAFRLAASFALSSIIIVATQLFFHSSLGPAVARYAAWLVLLLSAIYLAARGLRQIRAEVSRLGRSELVAICVLIASFALWLVAMPLSSYPGHLTVALGDTPAYYAAARDLVSGFGWNAGYYVGDYPGGVPAYVTLQPALALITAFFFGIVGVNSFALYVYGSVAGLLLVFLAATVKWAPSGREAAQGKRPLPAVLVFLLLPAYFLLSSLGAHTVPGALMFVIAASFSADQLAPGRERAIVAATAIILMMLLRPEAALAAVLLVACLLLAVLFRSLRERASFRPLIVAIAVGAACVLILWVMLPATLRAMPSTVKGFSIYTIRFEPATDTFEHMYRPWWDTNRRIAELNFSGSPPDEGLVNQNLGEEIQAHPSAFLRYLFGGFLVSTRSLAATYWPDPIIGSDVAVGVIVAVILLLGAIGTRLWWLAGATLLFLVVGPLQNQAISPRHVIVVSPTILSLALRSILQSVPTPRAPIWRSPRIRVVLLAGCLVFFTADYGLTIITRLDARNQTYNGIIGDVNRLTSPTDVIASSYPQLIYFTTGRQSVGSTRFMENIDPIIARFQPDYILVDKARPDAPNYYEMMQKNGKSIRGYSLTFENPEEGYMLFHKGAAPVTASGPELQTESLLSRESAAPFDKEMGEN